MQFHEPMFLFEKLQWPEPLGETHNIKLHRKATIPVFTPDLPFLQQSGLSITLKFLFHAQCIWLLSPKVWHECPQACPDGKPLSSSSFAFEYRWTLPFPASGELPVIPRSPAEAGGRRYLPVRVGGWVSPPRRKGRRNTALLGRNGRRWCQSWPQEAEGSALRYSNVFPGNRLEIS